MNFETFSIHTIWKVIWKYHAQILIILLGVYFEIKILFVSNIFIYISKIDTVAVCYKIGIVRYIDIVNKKKNPLITTPLLHSYALKTDHNFCTIVQGL